MPLDLTFNIQNNKRFQVYTLAGRPLEQIGEKGSENGMFWNPFGVCFNKQGQLLIADCGNNRWATIKHSVLLWSCRTLHWFRMFLILQYVPLFYLSYTSLTFFEIQRNCGISFKWFIDFIQTPKVLQKNTQTKCVLYEKFLCAKSLRTRCC